MRVNPAIVFSSALCVGQGRPAMKSPGYHRPKNKNAHALV